MGPTPAAGTLLGTINLSIGDDSIVALSYGAGGKLLLGSNMAMFVYEVDVSDITQTNFGTITKTANVIAGDYSIGSLNGWAGDFVTLPDGSLLGQGAVGGSSSNYVVFPKTPTGYGAGVVVGTPNLPSLVGGYGITFSGGSLYIAASDGKWYSQTQFPKATDPTSTVYQTEAINFIGTPLIGAAGVQEADSACSSPFVDVQKSAVSVTGPNASGEYQAKYEVKAVNVSSSRTVSYVEVIDNPQFSSDFTIIKTDWVSPKETGSATGPGPKKISTFGKTLTKNTGTATAPSAGSFDTYTVTVTFKKSATAPAEPVFGCGTAPAAGTGTFNTASVRAEQQDSNNNAVCAEPPSIKITAPANNTSYNLANYPSGGPVLSGTAVGGTGSVVVKDPGGATVCTATVSTTSPYTWTCPSGIALPDNATTKYTANYSTAAGTITDSITLTRDTSAPTAPSITGPTAVQNTLTPTISGTATEGGGTITVKNGATTVCTTTVSTTSPYTWSCPAGSGTLSQGDNSLTATQTDAASNTSPVSAAFTVKTDTIPPVPTITVDNVTADNVINAAEAGGSVNITGTVAGDFNSGDTVTIKVGADTWTGTVDGAGKFSIAVPGSKLKDATTLNASVTTKDAANNSGTANVDKSYTVDVSVPAAPAVTGPVNGSSTNQNVTTISGTGEPGAKITSVLVDGNPVTCSNAPVKVSDPGGTWTCTLSTAISTEGSHTVSAKQTDTAGNESATAGSSTFTIDKTKPSALTITPVGPTSQSVTAISGTGGEEGAKITKVTVDGVDNLCNPAVTVPAGGAWTCNLTTAIDVAAGQEQTFVVKAVQTDAAGNPSPEAQADVTVDKKAPAPTITVDNVTADNVINAAEAGGSVNITGAVAGDAQVGDKVTITVGGQIYTGLVDSSKKFSIAVPGSVLKDATTLNASITTKDAANNSGTANVDKPYTVDTTAPSPSISLNAVAGDDVLNATEAGGDVAISGTVSGDFKSGDQVKITVGGSVYNVILDGTGGFSVNVPGSVLKDNAKVTAVVETTDAAGNPGSATAERAYTVDTTKPSALTITPVGPTSQSVTAISGTGGEAGAKITKVTVDGVDNLCNPAVTVPAGGAWTCNLTTAIDVAAGQEQTFVVKAVQTDAAGNPSPEAQADVTVDKKAPAPTITVDNVTADNIINNAEATGAAIPITGTVGGDFKTDDTVTITVGTGTWSGKVDSSGKFTINVPAANLAAATTLNASITTTDTAGNTGTKAVDKTYSVDVSVPTAPVIDGPANGSFVKADVTSISGTGVAGSKITSVLVDDNPVTCTNAPVTVGSDNKWTCNLPADKVISIEGPHTVSAIQASPGGNESPAGSSTFTLDKTKPSAPTITGPADGSFLKTDVTAISGTGGEAGATITGVVTADGVEHLCSPKVTVTAAGWTCNLATPLSTEGTYQVKVAQTDQALNTSDFSPVVSFTIDKTPPAGAVSVTSVAGDGIVNKAESTATEVPIVGKVTGDFQKDDVVTVTVNGVDYSGKVDAQGNYTINVPGSALVADSDKKIEVKVAATDRAGNSSTYNTTATYTVQTTPPAPTVTLDLVATDGVINKTESEGSVNITGKVEGAFNANDPIKITVGGVDYLGTVKADGTFSVAVPGSALKDATDKTVTAVVSTTDAAGNPGTGTGTKTYTTDLETTVSVTGPTAGFVTVNDKPTIKGTGEAGATIIVKNGSTLICQTEVKANGEWQCDPLTSAIAAPGPVTLDVTAADKAGNTASTSVSGTIKAPLATAVQNGAAYPDGAVGASYPANTAPTVTGGVPGYTYSVPANAIPGLTYTDGVFSGTPTKAGTYNFDVTITDTEGNKVTIQDTVIIRPKTPTIDGPTDGATTNGTPTINGTGTPGDQIVVKNGATEVCTATVDGDGKWACPTGTTVPAGPVALTATAKDPTDPTLVSAESNKVNITVDNATTVAITSPTTVTTANTKPTITGTGENGATITIKDANGKTVCTTTVANGTWSCTPTDATALAEGSHELTVTAKDSVGNTKDAGPINVTVNAPLTVTPAAGTAVYPDDQVGTTYPANNPPAVTGGVGPYTYSVSGDVPPGLTFDPATGKFSGVPTTPGDYTFTVTIKDAENTEVKFTDTVKITAIPAPTITGPAQPNATDPAQVGLNPEIKGTNGVAGATVTVKDGTATVCTAVVQSDGSWSCHPDPKLTVGTHTFTATQTVTGANSQSYTSDVSNAVKVNATDVLEISGGTTPGGAAIYPDGTVSASYTDPTKPNVSGGVGPYTFALTAGSVPGLTLNADGTFTGTPTTVGKYSVTVQVRDSLGATASFTDEIVIKPAAPVITGPDGTTVGTKPKITGTGTPGNTVTVTDANGNTVCTATVLADKSWSCTPTSPLTGGTTKLTATQTDPADPSIVSPKSGETEFTVDATAPTAPAIAGPTTIQATTTPVISGTATEGGGTVTVKNAAGDTVCTATPADTAPYAWSCTASALDQGDNKLKATQTDAFGNESPKSGEFTVKVDTTPPPLTVTGPTGTVTTAKPPVSGTAEKGATITVTRPNPDDPANPIVVCTATADANGDWSCIPTGDLPQGPTTLTVTAKDAAGNSTVKTAEVKVDSVAPTAPAIAGPTTIQATTTPVISGTATEGGGTVTVKNAAGDTVCTATPADTAPYAWSCTASALDQGDNKLKATQTDAFGNESPKSGEFTVNVDSVAPKAPAITGPVEGTITGNNQPAITGTGVANDSITVYDGTTAIECQEGNPIKVKSDNSWTCTPKTALVDGPHQVTAKAADPIGNTSEASPVRNFMIDTVKPDAPVVSGPAAGSVTNDKKPTITGTGEKGAKISSLLIDGAEVICLPDPVLVDLTTGEWSCTLADELALGSHTVSAIQKDRGGNLSPASTPNSFKVLLPAPGAPAITGPTDGLLTKDNKPKITGTGVPGATVVVKDGTKVVECVEDPITVGPEPDKSWTCTPKNALDDGPHTFNATQTPTNGETSAASPAVTVNVDTTAPAKPAVTGPTNGATWVAPSTPITGSGEPGAKVTVKDGNTLVDCQEGNPVTVKADNTWTCTPKTPLSDGPHTINTVQTDQAGNPSPAGDPVSFTVGTKVAPAKPTISGPTTGTETNNPQPEISGTGENGDTVTVKDDKGNTICTAVVAGGTWKCTPGSPLKDGTHKFTATQTNPDTGMTSAPSNEITITTDATAPAAPSLTGPTAGSTVDTATPKITGKGEPGATVIVKDGDQVVECTENPLKVKADGTWECIPKKPLAEGERTITATQTDKFGNVSPAGGPLKFTVDTTPPAPPTIDQPINPGNISGKGEPGAEVTVKNADGATVCTATVKPDGTWSCIPNVTFPTGVHGITVTQKDAAGHTSGVSNSNVTVKTYIAGHVFYDKNTDKFLAADETDISNVTVELVNGSGVVVDTQVTHSPFMFQNVADGTYTVRVVASTVPAGLVPTTYPAGEVSVTVTNGQAMSVNFGYWYAGGKNLPKTGFDTGLWAPLTGLVLALTGGFVLATNRRRKHG